MMATDFEYAGQYLSEFGFIVCNFDYSDSAEEVSAGSVITFNKVPKNHGKQHSLTSTQYDECITATFDICKDPDIYDLEDREISYEEFTELMRWLNRREFLKFTVLDETDVSSEICNYMASFNVSKIKINERLYGLRLVMETDKPFGYGQEQEFIWDIKSADDKKVFRDMSQEIGSIFPDVVVTCKGSGDLTLHNSFENCKTVIKNCSNGEVITLHGDSQIIETSLASHDVCDDFNYEFFRIGNSFYDRENVITASIPCEIRLNYMPVIKDLL